MNEKQEYKVTDGERLFFRLSKSGRGVYVTNEHARFGIRGNYEHVKAVLRGQKDFAVLEVRAKTALKDSEIAAVEEDAKEEW